MSLMDFDESSYWDQYDDIENCDLELQNNYEHIAAVAVAAIAATNGGANTGANSSKASGYRETAASRFGYQLADTPVSGESTDSSYWSRYCQNCSNNASTGSLNIDKQQQKKPVYKRLLVKLRQNAKQDDEGTLVARVSGLEATMSELSVTRFSSSDNNISNNDGGNERRAEQHHNADEECNATEETNSTAIVSCENYDGNSSKCNSPSFIPFKCQAVNPLALRTRLDFLKDQIDQTERLAAFQNSVNSIM